MKAGASLAFDLPAPAVIDCEDGAITADEGNLLDQAINDFLNLLKIDTLIGFVLGIRAGCVGTGDDVHSASPLKAFYFLINIGQVWPPPLSLSLSLSLMHIAG